MATLATMRPAIDVVGIGLLLVLARLLATAQAAPAHDVNFADLTDTVLDRVEPIAGTVPGGKRDVHLEREGGIRGVLTVDGRPASGALHLYRTDRTGPPIRILHAVESEGGDFLAENLAPGRYRIVVHPEVGFPHDIEVVVKNDGTAIVDVHLLTDEFGRIEGSVDGLLDDETGRVTLVAETEGRRGGLPRLGVWGGREQPHRTAEVDRNGRFDFPGVPPGTYRVALRTSRGRDVTRRAVISRGDEVTLDIGLGGTAVAGVVTREGASDGACMCMVQARSKAAPMVRGVSDVAPDGSYRIEGIGNGVYALEVLEFASADQAPNLVVHAAGEIDLHGAVDFDINLLSTTLSGVVRSQAGPVAGAALSLLGSAGSTIYRTASAADGAFVFRAVQHAEYSLSVYKDGYQLRNVEVGLVARALDGVVVELTRDDGYMIRVVDSSGSRGLREIGIALPSGVRLSIALDEAGIGFLPSSLIGSDLTFGHPGFERVSVPNWDGGPLTLELIPERRDDVALED